MTPERLSTIKQSLARRQPDLTVLMENVRKPHNLAAVARTLEAVGGMDIHAVSSLRALRLSQMSAAGIRKWIRLHRHRETVAALEPLQQRGYQVIATTLSPAAIDYREADYTGPVILLAGEELEGLSAEALACADCQVKIPILGMVQSLNVSVATALVLYEALRQREAAGLYDHCRLPPAQYQQLLFEACHPQVARYCRDKGLRYPAIDDNAELLETITDLTASAGR